MNQALSKLQSALIALRCQAGLAVDLLPDGPYLRVKYFLKTHRVLHLRHPRTYSEKIQWLKVYGGIEAYGPYVDKYDVRDHITRTIGPEYLIPLIGMWEKFDDIPFDELPERFVLKGSHGWDFNYICRDKSTVDRARLKQLAEGWLATNIYDKWRSPQYKFCQPKLICEQYMEDESGELRDYKIPCFNGEPYMIQVIGNRLTHTTEDLYDLEWNRLPIIEKGYPNVPGAMPKPKELAELIRVARALSADFPYVRVDLYIVDGRVYFGELTFTPANGMITYEPDSADRALGDKLDLTKYPVNAQ